MINVNDDTIAAYKIDGVHKEYRVVLGNVSYGNDRIVDSTFNLRQAILDSEDFQAIGCIASSLSIELRAQFATKIRDQRIKVFLRAGNTPEIQVFDGYVNKCTKTANGWRRQIEAYDYFYTMSGQSGNGNDGDKKRFDITDWYNEHSPTEVGTLLNEVCGKFGLSVRSGNKSLVNGSLTTKCGSETKATNVSALDLIKAIMELNGCFGYITGDGYFSWKYLVMPTYDELGWLYPSAYLYPSTNLYPGRDPDHADGDLDRPNIIGEYENLEYQDFKMLPINKVVVRDHEKDENSGSCSGNVVTSDDNVYIIQGNMLILKAEKSVKEQVAKNVFDVLNSTWYVPFAAELGYGLPYIECGDQVNLFDFVGDYGSASLQRFYIMSRTLSGGQHLKDEWSANGNEYKREFVTGGGTESDPGLKDELEDIMDEKIAEAAGLYNIISVPSYADIPDPPAQYTLYCVQGELTQVDDLSGEDEPEPEPEQNQNEGE